MVLFSRKLILHMLAMMHPDALRVRQGAVGCFLVRHTRLKTTPDHTRLIDASMQLHMLTILHPDALWRTLTHIGAPRDLRDNG